MGAMTTPFGLSAIDQTYDLCGILEEIAPNVSELQLFKDDDPKVCMGRKCLLQFFPVVSISFYVAPYGRKCFAPSYFHLFTLRYLSLVHASLPLSLALGNIASGWCAYRYSGYISDYAEVIFVRSTLISIPGFR